MRDSIRNELRPERREMLEKERGEVTILSERQQVLLVKSVDVRIRVLLDDAVGDDDGATLVRSTNAIHGETTWQASDGTEEGLEGLGQVVRNVVLVHLYSYEIVLTEAWKISLPGSSSTTILPRSQAWFHHRYR